MSEAVHAFSDDVLADRDAVGIARLMQSGDVSAEEVITAAIARAQLVDPILNAVVVEDYDRAVDAVRNPLSGAFAGVPTFVKDMTDVAGLPTRFGSGALADRRHAKKTHAIARQLVDLGMISLGKSAMPDFGFMPSTEFPDGEPTRNPWNPDHSAGGSSGGAAALVAAGVVSIANAADGGGSIRIPAAACGLVGLKPTRGRMMPAQAGEPFVGLVTDGVLTRTVRDTALFCAENEKQHLLRGMSRIGHVTQPLNRPLRIGVVTNPPTKAAIDDVIQRELDTSVHLLEELGHHIEPFHLDIGSRFADDFLTLWSGLAFLLASTGRWSIDRSFDRSRLTDVMQGLAHQGRRNLLRLPGAVRRLKKSGVRYSRHFERIDVMLTPVVGQRTPQTGHLGMDLPYDVLFPRVEEWACFTPYANATGGPAISLPLGFDEEMNLPIGMMFSADIGEDRLLLELALQLEEAAPWRTIHQGRLLPEENVES